MINEVIVWVALLFPIIGLVRLACAIDLFRAAGETNHFGVHVLGKGGNDLWRITHRINRNKHGCDIDSPLIEDINRDRIARDIKGANIGTEGIAKVDERGLGDHNFIRHGRACSVYKLKRSPDIATCHGATVALSILIARKLRI